MLAYKYQGRDSLGLPIKGRLQATDKQAAIRELTQRGYFISQLELDRDVRVTDLKDVLRRARKISARDLAVFARQLGVLYGAGVPILPALTAIRQQQGEQSPLGVALSRVEEHLIGGDSLALALRENGAFPPILVNMVAAGEVGGTLDEALLRAATYFEREHEIGEKVKSALTYPKFVALVALGITWFLLASVVPNFATIFSTYNMELPAITRLMLSVSRFLVDWSWLLLTVAIALFLLFKQWSASAGGRTWLDKLSLRLPLLGKLVTMNALSRFCRTLATLLRSGVDMVSALELAEQTVDNAVYSRAVQKATAGIGQGSRLADELERSGLFPPMMLHMVHVGESSGALDSMLNQVADFYDQDLKTLTERLGKMIEPIVLLVMALVVGLIALAIALPMMQMVNVVQF
ncbi:MAG: type II secretion system F family protein [Firmicutes bacterium]|nr:type II secretion system F family protein [Bacillota bacterium]